VFTLNNYTVDNIQRLAQPYKQVKYIAYGKEVAPTTLTRHSQGYICCWEPQRMTFFKRQIPRAHMEPMQGRLQDNDKYVEKEGDLTTWGQKPDQGRRSDIVGLKHKIMEWTLQLKTKVLPQLLPNSADLHKNYTSTRDLSGLELTVKYYLCI